MGRASLGRPVVLWAEASLCLPMQPPEDGDLPSHPLRLGDLGLEQFSVSELFSSILIPGFFLLACILQLHYFHRPFMQLTDLEHVPPPGARHTHWARRCSPLPAGRPGGATPGRGFGQAKASDLGYLHTPGAGDDLGCGRNTVRGNSG